MSRLRDLLREVEQQDAQLAADLREEVKALESRRAFGLNFERHVPETVELPGWSVRKGDKVRFLPERGEPENSVDRSLWLVKSIRREEKKRIAELIQRGRHDEAPRTASRVVDDLVVVAEFRDPIYPGLVSTGRVEHGGTKPYHSVINAENYHALQALLYTHEGKVDAIYIDPPYNTRDKDWKYNNNYVDSDDQYKHSKWLAMMDRRLKLANRLLNPKNSVLIVTIDEKEYLRLGMLLKQIFPDANMQMISTVINSKGTGRLNEFRRVDEYIFYLWFGEAELCRTFMSTENRIETDVSLKNDDQEKSDNPNVQDNQSGPSTQHTNNLDWQTFRRRDLASQRGTKKGGPRQFYPIYVNVETGHIEAIGDPLPHDVPYTSAPIREGCVAVFPIRKDGTEMNWSAVASTFCQRWKAGYARAGKATPDEPQKYIIQYLKQGSIRDVEQGRVRVIGHDSDGSIIGEYGEEVAKTPKTQWALKSHNAEHYGTGVLTSLIPKRQFPFPKSIYAVEDALRFFIAEKSRAVIVDFFSGSGTTAHAIMRLNKQDGGNRQCISVTNNEVAADEQKRLRKQGLRPGDNEWEQRGICNHITKPRIEAAITGRTPEGGPIKGDYKFTDEFPMADGFDENVEFFTMTYEAPRPIAHHKSFSAIAPLLWLKAGAQGRRIQQAAETYDIAETYAVLFDLDALDGFLSSLAEAEMVHMVFIVTDDDLGFQMVCAALPTDVEAVRLYESYLANFAINTGRG